MLGVQQFLKMFWTKCSGRPKVVGRPQFFDDGNIKRIKPAVFVPYDLSQEGYTTQLWAFEGFTSYFDDLALLRAGVIDVDGWMTLFGKQQTRVYSSAGRLKQSVADSSFDAWVKLDSIFFV